MKITRVLRIILTQFVLLIILFFVLDFLTYMFLIDRHISEVDYKHKFENYFRIIKNRHSLSLESHFNYREPLYTDNSKKSIILFGCSYAYGFGVKNEETLSYRLGEITNRTVYNYGIPGYSIQHMLFLIRSGKIDNIIKESEYAIFILIGDHLLRSFGVYPCHDLVAYPFMSKKGNELILHKSKIPYISQSFLYSYIRKNIILRLFTSNIDSFSDKYFDFIKLHFEIAQKEMQSINPDIKMIIILYPDSNEYNHFLESSKWDELKEKGFQLINVRHHIPEIFMRTENDSFPDCYVADKYCVNNDLNDGSQGHPNALAWEKVSNLLTKKLGIIK